MLKIGDKMPQFSVADQNGNTVNSQDLIGKKTIIYFYPKDNTSGCTAQACNLRDNYEALTAAGYNVVGVSKDSAASHRKFIDKYSLPFTLLADTTTDMQQTFGVWAEKSLYGRKYMGTLRQTFIFDEEGTLVEIDNSQVAYTQAELSKNTAIYNYLINKVGLDKIKGDFSGKN